MQRSVVSIDNISRLAFTESGAFTTPVGAASHGALMPGKAYEWTFRAIPGDNLSFATMLVQSNDWFYSLQNQPLFDAAGQPIVGNFTHVMQLYDAGTEVDEPISSGPSTGSAERYGPDGDADAQHLYFP